MNDLEYITRKSLLYRSGIESADYGINHVVGCSHGCRYPCYALRMALKFGKVKDYNEWLRPKLVINAEEILRKELHRFAGRIRSVQFCYTTDPFMVGYPEITEMTLRLMRILNDHDIPVTNLTKGVLPEKLSDLSYQNIYGISVVSLNEGFRKKYEPFTAPYEDRIASLKVLSDKGFKTRVFMEPYPHYRMIKQDLMPILEKLKFVNQIFIGKLNYNSMVTEYDRKNYYYQIISEVRHFCHCHGIAVINDGEEHEKNNS